MNGIVTLSDALFQGTATRQRIDELSAHGYNSVTRTDFKLELIPLHSPLLRES